jgi:hypothetical protein
MAECLTVFFFVEKNCVSTINTWLFIQ